MNDVKDKLIETMTTGRVGQVVSAFEEFLGIADVKRAQNKLIEVSLTGNTTVGLLVLVKETSTECHSSFGRYPHTVEGHYV